MSKVLLDALPQLAELAKEGVRAFIIIGKTKGIAKTAKDDAGNVTVKQEVITGEGSSLKLKYAPGATTAGPGYEGAFIVDEVSSYQGYKSAVCLGFA